MNKKTKSTTRGFTLIELMLVILIIGVLSGILLAVINIPGVQKKSRDARRIADIKKIQTAIELYFSDYRGYIHMDPLVGGALQPAKNLGHLITSYLTTVPIDPSELTDSPVTCFGNNKYGYYYSSDFCSTSDCLASRYVIGTILEIPLKSSDPNVCINMNNCFSGAIACNCNTTAGYQGYCYAVENPL